LKARKEAEMAE
jgi:hypothetical protein